MAKEKPTWSSGAIEGSVVGLKSQLKINKNFAPDAPRVLKLIKNNWEKYIKLVDENSHDGTLKKEIIKQAKYSPEKFYIFLVNKVILRRFYSKMVISNTSTIWQKMPPDAKYLYNYKIFYFEKVYNPEPVRDFIRGVFDLFD